MGEKFVYTPADTVEIELRQLQCAVMQNKSTTYDVDGKFCNIRFDGWSCWPMTPAGTTANQSCPPILFFDPSETVFYPCDEDGEWRFYPDKNRTWVNYTTCVNMEDLFFRQKVNLIYSVGYGISLVALLLSLALLTYFKSLRCARITVHMNLFASFAVNNFLWLLWYSLVINNEEVVSNNQLWCRVLHIVLYTFLISNYSWMLCEGIYLHTVLVSAFISERRLLRWMWALGWGIPLLTSSIYVPVRASLGETKELEQCWMEESRFDIILLVPVVITVSLNVIFLFNIVRVLLIKLRRGPANNGPGSAASRTSLQALRATMLLVPLLGLNFLITPFRPPKNHPWEQTYEVVSAVTASQQGLCVAILFCFCNGEVIAQVKRKWRTVMFRPRANSCTVTTVSGLCVAILFCFCNGEVIAQVKRKWRTVMFRPRANSCTVTTVSFVRSSYPANGEEKV